MSRRTLWLLATALFLLGAGASFVGSQTVMGSAFVAVAMAMLVLALRERPRASGR